MQFLRRMVITLAAGYILMFYSESMFWARFLPGDSVVGYLLTWIVYSLSAFVFLSLISLMRVRTIWALFLCGAVYGWLTEGVIVQTMYDSFPLNISFTGLAWHALISVWVGWYAVRKVLLENRPGKTLLAASLIGLFWGFWGICWRAEEPATAATTAGFTAFSFVTGVLVMIAYWLYDKAGQDSYSPSKIELGIVGALFTLQFAVTAVPKTGFLALFILPPLLLIVFLVLRRNKRAETGDSLVDSLKGTVRPAHYLYLLAAPLMASFIYGLTNVLHVQAYTNQIVFLITMPLGAILFIVSLIKVWGRRPLASTPPQHSGRYWPNIFRFLGVCLAILAVLGLIGACSALNLFTTSATHPARVPVTHTPTELGISSYQDISFVTVDGVKLRGWYIPSQNGAVVILGHGHAGNRQHNLTDAQILASHGYGALLFDWRAHGESGGDRVTFGLDEVRDLDAAVDYVAARPDVDREKIGMIGFSMGGAVATFGAARDLRIKAVVIEGSYANFGDTARDRFRDLPPLVGQMTTWWGKLVTGVDADSIRPVDAICAISPRPVLLIYDPSDGALAPGSAQQMFDAACEPKELWLIEGAGHGGYPYIAPDEYERRIVQFFDRAISQQEPVN